MYRKLRRQAPKGPSPQPCQRGSAGRVAAKADEGGHDLELLQGARWEGGREGEWGGDARESSHGSKPAATGTCLRLAKALSYAIRSRCIARSGGGLAPCQRTIRVFGMWVAWDEQKRRLKEKAVQEWMKREEGRRSRRYQASTYLPRATGRRGAFPGRPSLNVLG